MCRIATVAVYRLFKKGPFDMTAISSTKTLKASAASALVLSALTVTPAFAQFATTSPYMPTGADASARTAVAAPGNSESLTVFQTAIAAAFSANKGGDVTFDNVTFAAAPSFTATYGTGGGNTLTVTDVLLPAATGTYGPGTDTANATSGSNYIGFAGSSNNNFNFTFSQNLSDFGIMVINRFSERDLTFTVNLSDGSTVTPNASPVQTSGTAAGGAFSPVFFEYAPTGGKTITSVTFTTTGLTRFDDLGFVAAPEPSQFAGLGLGVLGIGILALKARKRAALDR